MTHAAWPPRIGAPCCRLLGREGTDEFESAAMAAGGDANVAEVPGDGDRRPMLGKPVEDSLVREETKSSTVPEEAAVYCVCHHTEGAHKEGTVRPCGFWSGPPLLRLMVPLGWLLAALVVPLAATACPPPDGVAVKLTVAASDCPCV